MQLVLLNYNNYKNRQFKKLEQVQDYYDAATASEIISDYDFNPADGVDTRVTIGGEYYDIESIYDYLLVVDNNVIVSRWFVIDANRTRRGQYAMTLHRDVIADNWDSIKQASMYIEKATLRDDNPLIYNSEPASFNEIKTSLTQLKDYTNCGWIIGYVDRNMASDTSISFTTTAIPDTTVTAIASWTYYDRLGKTTIGSNLADSEWQITAYKDGINYILNTSTETWSTNAMGPHATMSGLNWDTVRSECVNSLTASQKTDYSESTVLGMINVEDTIIYASNSNKYYKASLEHTLLSSLPSYIASGDLRTYLQSVGFPIFGFSVTVRPVDDNTLCLKLSLPEVSDGEYNITFPSVSNRLQLKDAPYDMFCIPYEDLTLKNTKTAGAIAPWTTTMSKSKAMSVAQGIASQLGSKLFDMQLLPYCPLTGLHVSTIGNVIDVWTTEPKRFTKVTNSSSTTVAAIIWCTASTINRTINNSITVNNKKMENQANKYRIVSPNYNGTFEFSAVKNGGVSKFQISCTYLPYNPYIRVSPVFGGLYGNNYQQDSRGLICGGDFSVCYLSDKWVDYQIQNKNFQNSFDRDVQSMEVQRGVQRTGELVGSIVGIASGGVAGGIAGVGGAVAGMIAGAAGGIADMVVSEKLYQESLDLKKDQFALQLDNIKALPNSIARTTAYNLDNQLFPILEKYTCTEEEKKAFANMIAWEGMTVGAVGKISDFMDNRWSYTTAEGELIEDKGYIRGRLLRANLFEDFHMANTIDNELQRGVYLR